MTNTPWGKSQGSKKIIRGITQYYTASHGGLHISKKLNEKIPLYMRMFNGWYEEDCAWALAIVALSPHVKGIPNNFHTAAIDTVKNYYWKEYELFFNTIIPTGSSYSKDEYLFKQAHKNDYQVISAIGSWHANVPQGMIAVLAIKESTNEKKWFLVASEDYNASRKYSFVIDPKRHQQIDPID